MPVKRSAKKSAKKSTKSAAMMPFSEDQLKMLLAAMPGGFDPSDPEAALMLADLMNAKMPTGFLSDEAEDRRNDAQMIAFEAEDAATPEEALALYREALEVDPDCVDALAAIARTHPDPRITIAGLRQACMAGERGFGPEFFEQNTGDFWGIIETRPYMRTRAELAVRLIENNGTPEAIVHLEAMLQLNPRDNQGMRDVLLGAYLETDDLTGAHRLLRAYKQDDSAVFTWGRVLENFLAGSEKTLPKSLAEARRSNARVERYLTGSKKLPKRMPESYALGSEEEAILCMTSLGKAWALHPEAIEWLKQQAQPDTRSHDPSSSDRRMLSVRRRWST